MLLFISKGRNKQQHYGAPPEVGEPAHPRSFCKQNSLPGLPSRPHCVSDSSVTLRVTRGASRGLRPPLRGPLCGRARRFRHSPLRASAPSCARPAPHGAAKTPCPSPYRVGRRGFAPIEIFCRLSPPAPACGKKLDGPPTKLPPGPGLTPPFHHLWPPVRCASGLRPEMVKRLPHVVIFNFHSESLCEAFHLATKAWHLNRRSRKGISLAPTP